MDKKVGTQRENPDLKQVYVLVSAFRDGNSVVPVQFEIKEFYSAKSGLYLTVTLTKIDTGVLEETPADITAGDTSPLLPMSTYSLRSIFENVNPADGRFLKYVPDRFLNKAQLEAKHEALRKQTAEYASYAVETPEKSRTAATKKSIKDKQQDIDNAEGDLTLTKVGSTDIDGVTERSQNTPEERTALPNHGTQNDLSHEQRSDQEQPTVHSLLMETDASKVKNATERKYLKEYRQTANRQLAEQQKLDKLQAELDALPNAKRQTSRARFLRDELIKTKNRLQICQSIQTRLETDSPLTYLIHREIKPRLAETQKTAMSQTPMKSATLPSGQNSEADLAMENDKEPQEKQHASPAQTDFKQHYGGENVIANSAKGIIIKTGARIVDEYGEKAEAHAERYYGLVRSMTTDVAKIAKNTGFDIELVRNIKQFIFMEKHDLGNGTLEYFSPDFAMAESWRRLISGKYEKHDLTLLKHEEYERELMQGGMSQNEAHTLATLKFNYQTEARDFYGSLRENQKK